MKYENFKKMSAEVSEGLKRDEKNFKANQVLWKVGTCLTIAVFIIIVIAVQ